MLTRTTSTTDCTPRWPPTQPPTRTPPGTQRGSWMERSALPPTIQPSLCPPRRLPLPRHRILIWTTTTTIPMRSQTRMTRRSRPPRVAPRWTLQSTPLTRARRRTPSMRTRSKKTMPRPKETSSSSSASSTGCLARRMRAYLRRAWCSVYWQTTRMCCPRASVFCGRLLTR